MWARQGADHRKALHADLCFLYCLLQEWEPIVKKVIRIWPNSVKLLDAAIQLKNKLYEFTCKCLTINVIVYPVHFTQSYNVPRLTEETICFLTFRSIVFSFFPTINRIRENSSVQDRSSSCRVPSPRKENILWRFPGFQPTRSMYSWGRADVWNGTLCTYN